MPSRRPDEDEDDDDDDDDDEEVNGRFSSVERLFKLLLRRLEGFDPCFTGSGGSEG